VKDWDWVHDRPRLDPTLKKDLTVPPINYVNVINIYTITREAPMSAFAGVSQWDHPKPLWIALLALTLWISWPVALVLFAVLFWSGRLEGWKRAGLNLWHDAAGPMGHPNAWRPQRSSGNNAFDEYRSDTLRRLEGEEQEFREFLNRLRAAKDKAEFDQFMADRRSQARSSSPSPQS
jgi:hypothetical protein